ncbi:MAG TPA: tetratricopeptide repeat protein [Phycisphaerae bacterium]|nr:tetratricopeptide repeat protein [Phycisphaerae bacterium]
MDNRTAAALNQGIELAKSGQYEQAVVCYTRAIAVDSNCILAYYNRGIAYHELRQWDAAAADFDHVLARDPHHAGATNNRGVAHESLQQYDDAWTDFNRAIELNPNEGMYYNNRASIEARRGEFQRANADFLRAAELGYSVDPAILAQARLGLNVKLPDNGVNAFRLLGEKKYAEAAAALSDLIATGATDSSREGQAALLILHLARGETYTQIGDHSRAAADYTYFIDRTAPGAKSPHSALAEAYCQRGCAYCLLRQEDKAMPDFTAAINFNPDYFEAYYNRGNLFLTAGDSQKAASDLQNAARLKPEDVPVLTQLLRAQEKSDLNGALVTANHIVALAPTGMSHVVRASINLQLGRREEAIKDFSKAIEIGPDTAGLRQVRGETYLKMHDLTPAIADFNEVLRRDTGSTDAYISRAQCRAELGRYTEAVADFSRALELEPGYREAYYRRAISESNLRRFVDATRDLEQAKKLGIKVDDRLLGQVRAGTLDPAEAARLAKEQAVQPTIGQ